MNSPSSVNQSEVMRQYRFKTQLAAHILDEGGVIAHPTEAVWGLACNPLSESAVEKVLRLKQRPVEKGLILVSGFSEHFSFLTDLLSEEERRLFFSKRDRPTTWLLPDPEDIVPSYIKGQFESVAVRVSDHPLVVSLSRWLGRPIVSTSANTAGQEPARTLSEARGYFWNKVDAYVNGRLGGFDQPSQIIDIKNQTSLRV